MRNRPYNDIKALPHRVFGIAINIYGIMQTPETMQIRLISNGNCLKC
jgi:hypothetical protein